MCDTVNDPLITLWHSLLARPPMFQFAQCAHSSPQTVIAASKHATKAITITPTEQPPPFSYKGYFSFFEDDAIEIMCIKPMQSIAITLLTPDIEYLSISLEKLNQSSKVRLLTYSDILKLPHDSTEGFILLGLRKSFLNGLSLHSALACNNNLEHYLRCCIEHLLKDLQMANKHEASISALKSFKSRLSEIIKIQFCHCPSVCGEYPISVNENPASLESAMHFIHNQPSWEFSSRKLAKLANTSERNLYYQFKHYTQTSPYQYYLKNRLFKAREHIISESGYDETIAYHAVNSGFFHLSRFSSTYKEIFGELPSSTKSKRTALASN